MKAPRNVVRDILHAQGLWAVEPNDASVKVFSDTLEEAESNAYRAAYDDGYDEGHDAGYEAGQDY